MASISTGDVGGACCSEAGIRSTLRDSSSRRVYMNRHDDFLTYNIDTVVELVPWRASRPPAYTLKKIIMCLFSSYSAAGVIWCL